jgi:hypothetical protein
MRQQGLAPRRASTCNRRKWALLARRSARVTAPGQLVSWRVSCTGKRTALSGNSSTRLAVPTAYSVQVSPKHHVLACIESSYSAFLTAYPQGRKK